MYVFMFGFRVIRITQVDYRRSWVVMLLVSWPCIRLLWLSWKR